MTLATCLSEIATTAGAAILEFYRCSGEVWSSVKADDSPVTQADLVADRLIRHALNTAFPDIPILSEEAAKPSLTVAARRFFLVDPLDGTKEFLRRSGEFTVNIALLEEGVPVVGVVFAPALDRLFAAEGGLAWSVSDGQRVELDLRGTKRTGRLRVVGSRSHESDATRAWINSLEDPVDFVAAGSSLKFCSIAAGQADLYPRLAPTSQWDTAAAQCVLEAAGGYVLDLQGRPLRYGLDRPVLNPSFVAFAPSCMGLGPPGTFIPEGA